MSLCKTVRNMARSTSKANFLPANKYFNAFFIPVSFQRRSNIRAGPIFFPLAVRSLFSDKISRTFSEYLERERMRVSTRPLACKRSRRPYPVSSFFHIKPLRKPPDYFEGLFHGFFAVRIYQTACGRSKHTLR